MLSSIICCPCQFYKDNIQPKVAHVRQKIPEEMVIVKAKVTEQWENIKEFFNVLNRYHLLGMGLTVGISVVLIGIVEMEFWPYIIIISMLALALIINNVSDKTKITIELEDTKSKTNANNSGTTIELQAKRV